VPEFKAGGGFEPETYMQYFEDSNPPTNTEIGCKMPFLDGHYLRIGYHQQRRRGQIMVIDFDEARSFRKIKQKPDLKIR
jgi:hypothetical protein